MFFVSNYGFLVVLSSRAKSGIMSNAVEHSVLFHRPSRLLVVNNFSIMTVAKHIMTAVKEIRFFFTSFVSLRK